METPVQQIIQGVLPMSHSSYRAIEAILEYKQVVKGSTFIERGRYDNKEYFVLQGVCRSFVLNHKSEEITISFFPEGSILSPIVSRSTGGRSDLNFQALTDVKLGMLDAERFEALMIDNLEIRAFGNTVLRNELKQKVIKEIDLASATASQRLVKLRESYPQLENMVPHQAIASYLGITNISLSRLRRGLMK